MGTLIDRLTTDRVKGGRLWAAYAIGLIVGVAVALAALLVAGTSP